MRDRIDPLIAERAPWLFHGGWPMGAARGALMSLLRYPETIALATALRDASGPEIFRQTGARLAQKLQLTGLHHVPATGPALVVANHPTGIADGILLHHCLSKRRPDLYFYANADVLRIFPQMDTVIAPVEWRTEKRCPAKARATVQYTRQAVADGRLGIIFPSGRLSKRTGLSLSERPWMASAASIARKFDLPVIPVHIRAWNSPLFYALDLLHPTLRDITLFHETLNKDRQPYQIRIGRPIPARDLSKDPREAILELRQATLALGRRYPRPAQPRDPGWWASAARRLRSARA